MSTSRKTFFRSYMDNILFELFVYPYIEKEALSAIGDCRLWNNLYHYLENCCRLIEYELRISEERRSIPHEREIFVWNEVSDKED